MTTIRHREPGAHCSSCGAPLLWTTYSTGARMPLGRKPVAGGTLKVYRKLPSRTEPYDPELSKSGDYPWLCAWDKSETEPRYQSHFASCPDAADHRKAAGLKP